MSTTSTNGRAQRKSLAEQIDRLDLILDGLADGLDEAVAQAVQEAVAKAVEAALKEVLASAELQRRLRTEPAARPGKVGSVARALGRGLLCVAQGCRGRVATAAGRCRGKAARVRAAVAEGRQVVVNRARHGLSAFGRRLWLGAVTGVALVRHFRRPLLGALAVGALVGLGCYLAGPAVSSAVSGLAGFAGSLVASGLSRLRRVLAGEEPEGWSTGQVR